MNNLRHKFSEATKILSCGKISMWESVKEAYADHLSDISSDDLPEVLLVFYESIKLRVSLVETLGHIDNDEASYIAQDILYIADVIISQLPKSKEIESSNI